MDRSHTRLPYINFLNKKEAAGKYTWTIAMYPTQAMADEAGLSLGDCWAQITKACFLDEDSPVQTWKNVFENINSIQSKLNNLHIDRLHLEAQDTDLWLKIGSDRLWLGGSGRNIPSFEIFTSPDYHFTEGHIYFDMPLYRYGHVIQDISLTFSKGVVTQAHASKGEPLLLEMLAVKGANKIGEFSLTDKRFSHIDHYMAETLYDENYGGKFGNTHLALGMSFQECYIHSNPPPARSSLTRLGFNHSSVHTDIIATTDRRVTAVMLDGHSQLIYEHGQFLI